MKPLIILRSAYESTWLMKCFAKYGNTRNNKHFERSQNTQYVRRYGMNKQIKDGPTDYHSVPSDRTMGNVQNCDSYINEPSSQTHINLLGSQRRHDVFPVRYGQTYRVELSFNYISPTTAAPTSFKSKLNKSFTRRTSGHCLGTFQTAKLCFDYTPPPKR
jgi:hypothetical protein